MSSIRVSFTVADVHNIGEQQEFDDALSDEMDYSTGDRASPTVNRGQSSPGSQPEDRAAPADRESDEDLEPSFPTRVNVTIGKPSTGALLVQTLAEDGVFEIEQISYFTKPDLAHVETAEKDWARRGLYSGPPFDNLDEDLQTYFERYLEERGIDTELANLIPDYIQVKEQKEYVRWLEGKYPKLEYSQ
jgi:complement component 1 Q subcomponent-binding protein, mitochondrial